MSKLFSSSRGLLSSVLFSLILAAGCGREEIKTYKIAKPDAPASPATDNLPSGRPGMGTKPQISWTLPAGWQEVPPGQMSRASFNITDAKGAQAQVSITPLRGLSGKEVPIVNMWRQQLGLPDLSADEAAQQLKPVDIGGQSGKMFEVANKAEGGAAVRIVTAMIHQGDSSWFYKLAGDDAVVAAQKPAFVEFLKSIKITEVPDTETAVAPTETTSAEAGASFAGKVPADWKTVEPGQMQLAKFSVPDKGAAKADVMVSVFPSATGGTLANVNRWRKQIGLAAIEEADLATLAKPLAANLPDAVVVDMTSGPRQLIGAIVPRDGQWYFYKLLGDAEAVAPQKDAFLAFAQSKP